ncbi:MAG: hypothetical protein EOO82_00870 [Oxalobacteraceae bacterium]|nr:MAG: hypothetical protein EOO82_00870 [Oxalobacteraceae bacterium]
MLASEGIVAFAFARYEWRSVMGQAAMAKKSTKKSAAKKPSIGTTLKSLTLNFGALARDAQLVALMELTNLYKRTKASATKVEPAAKKQVVKAKKAAKKTVKKVAKAAKKAVKKAAK